MNIEKELVQSIDALFPQMQCKQCGYEGCLPYAEAIARFQAPINRCVPGGKKVINQLALLLSCPEEEPDPTLGSDQTMQEAYILPEDCIGCTLCIKACPVDAIIGTSKRLHTVIQDICTGCKLCVPVCPVDCISMIPLSEDQEWTLDDAEAAKRRYQSRIQRLAKVKKNHKPTNHADYDKRSDNILPESSKSDVLEVGHIGGGSFLSNSQESCSPSTVSRDCSAHQGIVSHKIKEANPSVDECSEESSRLEIKTEDIVRDQVKKTIVEAAIMRAKEKKLVQSTRTKKYFSKLFHKPATTLRECVSHVQDDSPQSDPVST